MPRAPRPYHHGDLRNALLIEAAKLIEAEGVDALTLRQLARRLGVSHAAPTNHFSDKEALLVALASQGFDELADDLAAAPRGRTAVARLREVGRAYVRFARRRPGHYRVMFGRGFSSGPPLKSFDAAGMRAYDVLQECVLAALPLGARGPQRVREASFLAWSLVHGAAMLILDGPLIPHLIASASDDRAIAALVDHATDAIASAVAGT